ncbi:MAG: hypothetical protein IAF08_11495, partial [Rhizobacter sp.]|nr:hypothetical protein [Chlorobiales bacterium]
FDTKRKFYSGDEASSEVAALVMTGFRKIAKALNVSVILLSHVVKSHTSITISSLPGNARWGGDLDIAWYIQSGENNVYLLTNVKRRNFSEVKPIKCKCIATIEASDVHALGGRSAAKGFELTDEEYIVKAAESNRTMIVSASGAGRPRAVEMEQANEVLEMMGVEFWSWQFRNMATERFRVSRATVYRLLEELVHQKRIAAMQEPENGKAARYIKLSTMPAETSAETEAEADAFAGEEARRDARDDIPF